jgi:hypothetical protein
MKERQIRRFPVVSETIDDFFQGELMYVGGLPDDVTVLDSYYDQEKQTYFFILESDDFEPVIEGERIPELVTDNPQYDDYYVDLSSKN